MTKLKTINEIKKGCGKNLEVYHGIDEKIFWKCGEDSPYNFDLCPICQAQLQTTQDIYDEIEKCKIIEVRQDLEQEGVEYILIDRNEIIDKLKKEQKE